MAALTSGQLVNTTKVVSSPPETESYPKPVAEAQEWILTRDRSICLHIRARLYASTSKCDYTGRYENNDGTEEWGSTGHPSLGGTRSGSSGRVGDVHVHEAGGNRSSRDGVLATGAVDASAPSVADVAQV